MATRIRLRRVGRKKQPSYRIVVTDKAKARDGRFVELLGHYDPRTEPATLKVDQEKARTWLSKGATPSDTVRSLLKKAGVFQEQADASATSTAEESEQPSTDASATPKDDTASQTSADASADTPAEA